MGVSTWHRVWGCPRGTGFGGIHVAQGLGVSTWHRVWGCPCGTGFWGVRVAQGLGVSTWHKVWGCPSGTGGCSSLAVFCALTSPLHPSPLCLPPGPRQAFHENGALFVHYSVPLVILRQSTSFGVPDGKLAGFRNVLLFALGSRTTGRGASRRGRPVLHTVPASPLSARPARVRSVETRPSLTWPPRLGDGDVGCRAEVICRAPRVEETTGTRAQESLL